MDVTTFRLRFPDLRHRVHAASCSLGARSDAVEQALNRMLHAMAEHGAPWPRFEAEVTSVRAKIARLINARPEQIALLPNASIGAYQVASSRNWTKRRKVITTGMEFPSIAHVWLAQRPGGAEVTFSQGDDQGEFDTETFAARISDQVNLVSLPLVTYLTGSRMPVEAICRIARSAGAATFVDGYQAVGVFPVDVRALGCDYLVAGTMKYMLGLPGLAFLYARSLEMADRPPTLTGWFGQAMPFAFDPYRIDFAAEARRFETGTPSIPAVYAASAGLDLIEALDLTAVQWHVATLIDRCARRLRDQGEFLAMALEPDARGAHLALLDPDPTGLASFLASQRVIASPRGAVLRLSFHYYNTFDDVDDICRILAAHRSRNGNESTRIRARGASAVVR